ncbi:putative nuclease HARBI1 [Ornithodoros turicata]|uniref:putative nuclease HARBI1 n=1 Tax=Ornithodoros turicata TaxID=34597 RepID=UPI00313A2966
MAELYAFLADEGVSDSESSRHFREHRDAFDSSVTEEEFIGHFRLSKAAARQVCDAVADDLRRSQQWRSTTLSVEQRVLMALRFYATGAFLDNIASDEFIATTKRPVSEAIHAVSLAIIKNLGQRYLKFPASTEEKVAIKRDFYAIAGAIDGTAIAIIAPSRSDPRFVDGNYYSHKGYHALNVLGICDANRRFLHIDATYPGSCHDSSVWSMCEVRLRAPTTFAEGEWLLGDLGYPLEPWLLTPVRSPATQKDQAYNKAHCKTRVRIEQCFGVLKMRFRCLHRYRTLHFAPDRACNIITACAVLHTICIDYNLQDPEHEDEGSDPDPPAAPEDEWDDVENSASLTAQAVHRRQQVVNRYF